MSAAPSGGVASGRLIGGSMLKLGLRPPVSAIRHMRHAPAPHEPLGPEEPGEGAGGALGVLEVPDVPDVPADEEAPLPFPSPSAVSKVRGHGSTPGVYRTLSCPHDPVTYLARHYGRSVDGTGDCSFKQTSATRRPPKTASGRRSRAWGRGGREGGRRACWRNRTCPTFRR